jgi:hypothetical protein
MNRIATSFLIASTLAVPSALTAQTSPAPASITIAPPVSPLLISYQYWPVQYVQWVGTELPYAMIEFDMDAASKPPVYRLVLSDRATNKRIEYSNNDNVLAAGKAFGNETHKTAIAFDPPESDGVGATSTVRLTLADGKPLQWRFIQGTELSDQGSGLTALPEISIPVLAYREQAAVAGEGTALQIGDVVSNADVWKEISHPPYFIGYHGALTSGAHRATLYAGEQDWTVTSAPPSLAVGSTWELDSKEGNHRTLKVEKIDGTDFTIAGNDRYTPTVAFEIEATRTGDIWNVERVRYAPVHGGDKHFLTVQLSTKPGGLSTAEFVIGKKTRIASATLTSADDSKDHGKTFEFQSPAWAKGKVLTEQATITPTTVSLVATKK